ncbi:MAG: 16S rRNA (adenine(1518)-N(6)/adenine(1519)-N(6))-dimethyltransferase RsmA [Trueperaceae bacterium]
MRALLARHGLTADKAFGQNFLVDRPALRAVVDAGDPGPSDTVLEVGPGLGVLTRALAERGPRVIAVELDARLLPALRETTEGAGNVEIVHADAVRFDHRRLPPGSLLIANLPYAVATAIVAEALRSGRYRRLVVVVQREVAERMVASPGQVGFGAFSLVCRHWSRPTLVRHVAPGAFLPPPKVASSIVRFEVRPEARDRPALFTLIRDGFRHRRKTLRKNLVTAGYDADAVAVALVACGLAPMIRAEALDLATWSRLAETLGVHDPGADAGAGRSGILGDDSERP